MVHFLAGQVAAKVSGHTVNIKGLRHQYYNHPVDPGSKASLVSFGTSGHRGNPLKGTFNDGHIAAITQAICDFRREAGTNGPVIIGLDTHASSLPALKTAVEVLVANGVEIVLDERQRFNDSGGFTPTPAISFAILEANRGRASGLSDGIVITPSHNPPEDGGFKYNPANGGPAGGEITGPIQDKANFYLVNGGIKRMPLAKARRSRLIRKVDLMRNYLQALDQVIDLETIRRSQHMNMGVAPLGGSTLEYWQAIHDGFGLPLALIDPRLDMTFKFMPLDHDGQVRMDPSSPYAMAALTRDRFRFSLKGANDTDGDRHGIFCQSVGLMNPNHFLSAAVWYLLQNRPDWPASAMLGKTIVTTSLLNRIAAHFGRQVYETPVGFKFFADGLFQGDLFCGLEESAGASILRHDGSVWTTDKDGIIMVLLALEMMAATGKDPGQIYAEITSQLGTPSYTRVDTPASPEVKAALKALQPSDVKITALGGEPIEQILTKAPNGDAIGGLYISTANAWICIRPSGTEDIAKVYAESFLGQEHLQQIIKEAQAVMAAALRR